MKDTAGGTGDPTPSQLLSSRSRISAVTMCGTAKAAHIGSSLSIVDVLAVLYTGAANIHPTNVNDSDRDIVIVSKGHAAAGTYATLGNAGFFPMEWLDGYCVNGGPLGGHVTKGRVPGVELSTGSLGHGLPFGVGVALGRSRQGRKGRVFVVMSDGEQDEGSNWEAALLAGHHELTNLTVIIDRNGIQSLDSTEATLRLEPLAAKWSAFGWATIDVDGHNHAAIGAALQDAASDPRPTVVIAKTVKGKGVSFMEDQVLWHYRPPTGDAFVSALSELQEPG